MASISGVCSSYSSSALRHRRPLLPPKPIPSSRHAAAIPIFPSGRLPHLRPPCSIADLPRSPSTTSSASLPPEKKTLGIEKDPIKLWRRYVDWLYQHKELGLFLDVSRIAFTDEFLAEMEPRLQKAFHAMQELEKGAIANPDEGRMVGHYWLRDPKLAPNSFLRLQIENTLDAICKFADDIISAKIKPPSSPAGRFTQILSVGIGGSSLGPQFVAEALAPDNPPLKIRFIDNTDPAGIDHQIAQLGPELASTLVIVISKSGGTPETRNGLLEVQKAFREAGLDFSKQGVAITQQNSLLDNAARIEGWLARFPMFDWVGGRTSEMSAVGLLPASLQGIDIKEMLVGASLMDEANRTTVVRNNPAALLALCWYWASDGVGSKDMVVLPYKDSLLLFSRYLQQLVMESLGKEFDLDGNRVNQGITVYGNKGSTDQHAYIQQLREGVHNFFVTFIEVLRDRPPGHDWELEPGVTCGDYLFGMLQGTRSALYANDRESITVTVQEVTPRSVGALVALYERAVGIYACLININAYHQPGVEAGKKAAGDVLALQKRVLSILNEASCKEPVEPLTLDEIAERCHAPEQIEMIYKIIAHVAANDRALIAEGNCGSPRSIKVFLGECNVDELLLSVLDPMVRDPRATHNCWAYKLGDQYRSNDDGEPSGTAGKPMYSAIVSSGLDMVMVVVIRYFGGIKLGTGGLVRAYGGVASECLKGGTTCLVKPKAPIGIEVPFELLGTVYHQLQHFQAEDIKEDYDTGKDGVTMVTFRVEYDKMESLEDAINSACSRKIEFYKR